MSATKQDQEQGNIKIKADAIIIQKGNGLKGFEQLRRWIKKICLRRQRNKKKTSKFSQAFTL